MGWKEKPHRKLQKQTKQDNKEEVNHIQEEILKMQGLQTCGECFQVYKLYDPRCAHCDAPNKSFYPAKV